jgi:hypothetical protein
MTAAKITHSLSRNGSCLMHGVSFLRGIDATAGQAGVTLARGYGR